MNCYSDICEFFNVVVGGIFIGIIASCAFVWLTQLFSRRKFRKTYKHLESKQKDSFDWTAYSMQKSNGRKREENPNGSMVNIQLGQEKLLLKLKQSDDRIWIGELEFQTQGFGILFFKYESEHEYGQKQCIVGTYTENVKVYDYIFLTPLNDRIFNIEKTDDKNSKVVYNYGNELLIRINPVLTKAAM